MPRSMEFVVKMVVPDDDQTDPEDMVQLLADVLNVNGPAANNWVHAHREWIPETRPVFHVLHDDGFHRISSDPGGDEVWQRKR